MNVIAVDDEKIQLASLKNAIEAALPEAEFTCFSSSASALDHARSLVKNRNTHVDVAFLDVEMRGMDGLELAKELREIHNKINVVFVTGYLEYAINSYEVDASAYLLKPVSEEKVHKAMLQLRDPIGGTIVPETIPVHFCSGHSEGFDDILVI